MTLFLGGSMSRSSFIPPGCARRGYRGAGHRSGASPTDIDILIHAALPWAITIGGSLSSREWINHLRVLPCRFSAGWMIFVSGLVIIKCPLTAAIPHKSEFGSGLVNIPRSTSQNAKNDILAWVAFTASLQQRLNHTAKLCLRIVIISPETPASPHHGA